MYDISSIKSFLLCETPDQWLSAALANLPLLLVDHANCELKAAQQAQALIWKYGAGVDVNASVTKRGQGSLKAGVSFAIDDRNALINKMSTLAREELRHFEQVIDILKRREIDYVQLSSARYAAGMRVGMRTHEPERLVDNLIIGAFIEARSCERFARLSPLLDDELKSFYQSLLKSESRHFQDYLKLAQRFSGVPIADRIEHYAQMERELIEAPDKEFRFHSGPCSIGLEV
ncbi:MAG: tRNA isopentenyl-2-thiomethyl-A-37 hydroxylase MiaE [Spongiibacteraceae bacterium]